MAPPLDVRDGGALDAGRDTGLDARDGALDTVDAADAQGEREDLVELGMRDQPAPAVQVVVSRFTACMVLADGSLWCWGSNNRGDVGDGTLETRSTPVRVLDRDVVKVTMLGPACALRTNGELYCWGYNGEGGVTGRPSEPIYVLRPTRVEGLPRALDMATSGSNNCLISEDRRVWCWGNGSDALGTRAAPFSDLRDVARLSFSNHLGCAVLGNGRIRCWAWSPSNECGTRASQGACRNTTLNPSYVDDIDDAVDVVVGEDVACAIRRDRSLWCWGGNNNRQLGAPSSDRCECSGVGDVRREYPCAWSPQRVPLPGPVAQVDAADRYARVCAVLMDGSLWCWGDDISETVEPPPSVPCVPVCFGSGASCRAGPARIYDVQDAVEVGVGVSIDCMRRRNGEVRCWRGATAPSTFPTRWW